MVIIRSGNYSLRNPQDEIPEDSTITGGNFSQALPATEILVGKRLTIAGGNWINVRPDAAWIVTGGNWAQIERCSHRHPELLAKGLIAECPVHCKHASPGKIEREVGEEEFREKAAMVGKQDRHIEKTEDALGVTKQRFFVSERIYKDCVIS